MPRLRAAVGSVALLVVAPGVVGSLVPWRLSGWDAASPSWPLQGVGVALIVVGVAVLLHAFARFVLEGAHARPDIPAAVEGLPARRPGLAAAPAAVAA